MTSPTLNSCLPFVTSLQFTLTSPDATWLANFERETRNPALPRASNRVDASDVLISSTLGVGTRNSDTSTSLAVTLTVRTDVNAVVKNSHISGVVMTSAPRSPRINMSPIFSLAIPVPNIAPKKSRCVAASNIKLPSTRSARTVVSIASSSTLSAALNDITYEELRLFVSSCADADAVLRDLIARGAAEKTLTIDGNRRRYNAILAIIDLVYYLRKHNEICSLREAYYHIKAFDPENPFFEIFRDVRDCYQAIADVASLLRCPRRALGFVASPIGLVAGSSSRV